MSIIQHTDSKLRIFLVLTILATLIASCKKSELDVIPYVYVEFTISSSDPEFVNFFEAAGSHLLIDASTNNMGVRAAGYDGNGIILYCAQPGEYFAFDRTCPHEFAMDGTSIAVNVGEGEIFADCPVCESKFALPSFGTPSSGPSKYPLKIYRTTYNGGYLRVYN